MAGNLCNGCNGHQNQIKKDSRFKVKLENFQDMSIPIQTLDRYDTFYRLVCQPLHCMQVSQFYAEIDFIYLTLEQTESVIGEMRTKRQDSDMVPQEKFMNQFLNSQLMPEHQNSLNNTMMKILQIEGLFQYKMSISDLSSLNNYDKLKLKRHGSFTNLHSDCKDSIFEEDNNYKKKNIRAHSGRRSISGKIQTPSFIQSQQHSFIHIPELNDMMNVNLEPSVNQMICIQTGPDCQLIKHQPRQFKVSTQKSAPEKLDSNDNQAVQSDNILIDLFPLKILALMMCQGSNKVKAELFMDLIIGIDGLKQGESSVPINSKRLMRATQLMCFFSEVFPKQFQEVFESELNSQSKLQLRSRTTDQTQDTQNQNGSFKNTLSTQSKITCNNNLGLYWSKLYVQASNEFLHTKYNRIYANMYVNKLFSERDSLITRRDLMKNVCGTQFKKPKCNWLFDSKIVRDNFRQLFDSDMENEDQ